MPDVNLVLEHGSFWLVVHLLMILILLSRNSISNRLQRPLGPSLPPLSFSEHPPEGQRQDLQEQVRGQEEHPSS